MSTPALAGGADYTAIASLAVQNGGSTDDSLSCQLVSGTTPIDSVTISDLPAGKQALLVLSGADAPTTSGAFSVQCFKTGLAVVFELHARMTVMLVGALN